MKDECVFNSQKQCPVRKSMHKELKNTQKINAIIKPLGDSEVQKMFLPMIERMEEMLVNEFSILHNYCEICMVYTEK